MNYPVDDINTVKEALVSTARTIAVAESVTSGLLQNALAQARDARLFFQGGMTVYNVAQKCRLLDVEPITADQAFGVSEVIAAKLASKVAQLFCSAVGVGIVGYAAPVPERQVHQPFAYYSFCVDGRNLGVFRLEGLNGSALDNQLLFVRGVIHSLRDVLCK